MSSQFSDLSLSTRIHFPPSASTRKFFFFHFFHFFLHFFILYSPLIDLPENFIEETDHVEELFVFVSEPGRAHVAGEHVCAGGHHQLLQLDPFVRAHVGQLRQEFVHFCGSDLVESVVVSGCESRGAIKACDAATGFLQFRPVA